MRLVSIESDKTLEELEGEDWGEQRFPSYVVTTCVQMRRKPLRELSDEEIRLALGQQMGVRFLLPIALQRLQSDPLVRGDMYEGALLKNVLDVATPAVATEDCLADLDRMVERFEHAAAEMDQVWREECLPAIASAIEQYQTRRKRHE